MKKNCRAIHSSPPSGFSLGTSLGTSPGTSLDTVTVLVGC